MTHEAGVDLDSLGLSFGTDKSSADHGYLSFYEEQLGKFQKFEFTMIEIGVYQGGSLKTWGSFFRNARVIGVDVNEPLSPLVLPGNCFLRIGDGTKIETHDELIAEFGKPLIVVDDGSHTWHHQIQTLRNLWPRIKSGGVFVMEDIHTSFPGLADGFKHGAVESCYAYLQRLQRWVVGSRYMGGELCDDGFIEAYWPTVKSMHYFRGTCLIFKR